ncbi:hypothetical protein FD33_GL002244 [Companilactobacillus paralimentarius DSM 13238 = JCM 10415]|uniref:Uncharacterized protein n=1 Tax=Companilactobacillus paralimentarius DSM 13238 = JCM 10415 TaxID=1122151 RepID=A0A0R1PGG5_9LACO|nr:hypothetical protein [Companilactobacillus paralimentarius]KAE9563283.1 hypothetical protein ATN96_11225 [Companilactobacillus paralimentarius]KRL31183.1 hypothetical protein FD33_GL002244 [Companilactobacillus paralimentarius DSM 13238 = JCM 10415]
MQQVKEPIRLLPEQKTFMLPQGQFRRDSIENVINTTITGSDTMARVYKSMFDVITRVTNLDDENSHYQGDIELNRKLITIASLADWCQKRFDQKTIAASPNILKLGSEQNESNCSNSNNLLLSEGI